MYKLFENSELSNQTQIDGFKTIFQPLFCMYAHKYCPEIVWQFQAWN